jgi:pyridoxine 4-dehydrogenase
MCVSALLAAIWNAVARPSTTRALLMTDQPPVTAAAAGTIGIGGDLTVNRLGYGAMQITGEGVWSEPPDRDEALAVLRRAVELGVNFIDTADSYGPRVSETLIAEALYPYPDDLVIATKGGLERPSPGPWPANGRPEHLKQACEGSLQRLKLEQIALYQLHRPDPQGGVGGVRRRLGRAAGAGQDPPHRPVQRL